jgi:hypothetical protein
MIIGDRLREMREEKNLSQSDIEKRRQGQSVEEISRKGKSSGLWDHLEVERIPPPAAGSTPHWMRRWSGACYRAAVESKRKFQSRYINE